MTQRLAFGTMWHNIKTKALHKYFKVNSNTVINVVLQIKNKTKNNLRAN